jgi:DNA-directed RNA polymerase alpha subunit
MNINIKEDSPLNVLKFDIHGVKMSLVNALRRIMISEVDTVAFETSNFQESSVKITENTSQFHNEFILHRIGLIPINIPDTANFNESDYTFSLDVENKTNSILYVTSGDIKVMNNTTGQEESTEKFFPKDPISNDNIIMVRLQPNPAGNNERISFTASARIGNGGLDARYSPTAVCFYTNTIDPELASAALEIFKQNADPSLSAEQVKRKFIIGEAERHFSLDADGEPDKFSFTVESIGVIPPQEILGRAINILNDKLEKFQVELDKKDSVYLDIEETPTSMDAYDITVDSESHTLGFVIQEHANKLIDDNELLYVGYMNPHPLKKNIKIRVALNNNNVDNVVKQLKFVCKNIINQCNGIKSGIEKKFGQIGMVAVKAAKPEAAEAPEAEAAPEPEVAPEPEAAETSMEGGDRISVSGTESEEELTDYGSDEEDEDDDSDSE